MLLSSQTNFSSRVCPYNLKLITTTMSPSICEYHYVPNHLKLIIMSMSLSITNTMSSILTPPTHRDRQWKIYQCDFGPCPVYGEDKKDDHTHH